MAAANHQYRRAKSILDVTATLSVIAASGALVWSLLGVRAGTNSPPPTPANAPLTRMDLEVEATSIREHASIGSSVAGVVIIEYSDFECPFCARFAQESWPDVRQQLVESGRVRWVF